MILPDFVLPSRVNQVWAHSGMDSPDRCQDPVHFKSYPHIVEYRYNSRGYRDQEWPSDPQQLQQSTWCIGDSFTVGLGSPWTHTWPYLLGESMQTRTINVSMDGASNHWMARKARVLLEHLQPKIMIMHWTYVSRSELPMTWLTDEQRRRHFDTKFLDSVTALTEFRNLILELEACKASTRIIHSFVPGFSLQPKLQDYWHRFAGSEWPPCPGRAADFDQLPDFVVDELKNKFQVYDMFRMLYDIYSVTEHVAEFDILDRSRDGHHYDLVTAQNFVTQILQLLHGPA